MAAAAIAARHWASEDPRSFKFSPKDIINKSKWGGEKTKKKPNDEESKSSRPNETTKHFKNLKNSENLIRSKKISKNVSRVRSLAVAKIRKLDAPKDPTRVKPSALLYEITERTNQLAQPRARKLEASYMQPRPILTRIPEPSKRILELSQPKAIYSKPENYADVAPAALRAIATRRIIELSKPRKKRRPRVPKKKEAIYAPCSPRIVYLSRPKRVTNTNKRSEKLIRQLLELTTTRKQQRREKRRRIKRKRGNARRTRSSNSNRTVITIDLSGSGSRGSRKGTNATNRRKSKRSKPTGTN